MPMFFTKVLLFDMKSLLLHFQASPEERTYTLCVIVADGFAYVVLEAAISSVIRLLDVWARTRPKAANFAAFGETDCLVGIHFDELFDDTTVCFNA